MFKKILFDEEVLASFNQLLAKRTGIVIRDKDKAFFQEKLGLRIQLLKLSNSVTYYQFLETATIESDREWEKLITLLTNNESYFFRDKEQFNLLKNYLIPEIVKRKQIEKTLRICSAGCSTGQEPYSIAIMLKEILPNFQQWNISILGIDIDREALAQASQGIYDPWSFRGVSEEIKQRYFQKTGDRFQLKPDIKQLVKFQNVNLVKDPFPQQQSELKDMDLILCRNVFIYFESAAIAQVLDKLYHTLHSSGYFLSGHTELSGQDLSQFKKIVFPESIVYQRLDAKATLAPRSEKVSFTSPIKTPDRQPAITNYSSKQDRVISALKTQPLLPKLTEKELMAEAENFIAKEQYDLAIARIQQVLQINANHLPAHHRLAQIYADIGQYEKAIQSCQQAMKIDSFAVTPYYLLAKIAEEKHDTEEAKRILKQIIYLEANSVGAYLDLSHIYDREGDIKRAKKMQEAARNILQQLPPNTKIEERGNITAIELLGKI